MLRLLKQAFLILLVSAALLAAWAGFEKFATAYRLTAVAQRQGIQVVWQRGIGMKDAQGRVAVRGEAPGWIVLSSYSKLVEEEIGLYPAGAWAAQGIEHIILQDPLLDGAGHLLGGMNWRRKAILLNAMSSSRSHFAGSWAIHHEFFHKIDRWGYDRDRGWSGGRYLEGRPVPEPWDGPSSRTGFLDNYSQSNPGEDKAQVFAALMCRSKSLARLCAQDAELRRKTELMKSRLRTLSPAFDDAFFARLDARPLAGGEWAWEADREGEQVRLEPPHVAYEPVSGTAVQGAYSMDANAAYLDGLRQTLPQKASR